MSEITTDRTTAEAPQADKQDDTQNPGKRKLLLTLLGAAIVISAAGYGAYWYTSARFYQSTDDAYVSGNLVQLTPQVSGTVIAVNADDTQVVKQGDPVVMQIGRAHV